MNQEQIDRINTLYRKSKAEGLTGGREKGAGAAAQAVCCGCEEKSGGAA